MAAPPPPAPPPDSHFPKPSSAVIAPANNNNTTTNNNNNNNRSARRSLAKDLCREQVEALSYNSPRLFTKKHLLLLQQQQRQYQFVVEDHNHNHNHSHHNLLNSRRVYPSATSRSHQFHILRNGDISTDCSNHGSPQLLPRKVPKKMVVDEKQLAMKLLRARNALACSSSSTSSSSSSSESASLRASAEAPEFPLRSSAAELARRSLLSGCVPKSQMNTLIHPKPVTSSGYSRNGSDCDSAAGVYEKKVACVAATGSGRSSDAEESVRSVRNMVVRQERTAVPVLLRSASCSSATPSSLNKMVRLKAADMALGMQEHAFYCANEVLEGMEKLHCKRVAWALKKEFDKSYGPAWHCVVGTSFGSYVTHSVGGFLYFSIGKVSVLLFQTAVELIEHQ